MNRRTFLRAAAAAAAAPFAGAGYGFAEAGHLIVARKTVAVPRLPAGFCGATVAFLADIHHGPYVSADFVAAVVRTTTLLAPDLILLGGDYSLREARYIGPCFDVLSALSAPLGVYGVLGNHDYWHGLRQTRAGLAAAGVDELTNRGVWLARRGDRLRVGGVDDLWCGSPDVAAAVGDAKPADACILMSHNPDVAETLRDRRVGLVLSGHTHGGQVVLPGDRAPWTPSLYGRKYARGLVEAPATKVYVSCGVGLSGVPVRLRCRPEITLLTLT